MIDLNKKKNASIRDVLPEFWYGVVLAAVGLPGEFAINEQVERCLEKELRHWSGSRTSLVIRVFEL